MQTPFFTYRIWLISLLGWGILLGMPSCRSTRHLEEHQKLYTGSTIVIESEEKIHNASSIKNELERVISPQPNERIFYLRPRLFFYNLPGKEPSTRIGRWIKETMGRPPVLLSDFNAESTSRLIQNRLFNKGFFDAEIDFQRKEKRKKAKYVFTLELLPAYTIEEIILLDSTHFFSESLEPTRKNTVLKTGKTYNLEQIKDERTRIERELKEEGYYYFQANHLLFRADTTLGNRKISLGESIAEGSPERAFQKQTIQNIFINSEHSLDLDSTENMDTITIAPSKFLLQKKGLVKAETIDRAIFLEPGEYYSLSHHNLSLNYLTGLGMFKFVNLRIQNHEEQENALDVHILLTPMDKINLSYEIRAVGKDNSFYGPGLNLTLTNINLLGGAEKLNFSVDGSFETLLGQGNRSASSIEAGTSTELSIPRFVGPRLVRNIHPEYIPQTRMSLSYRYLSRTDAFNLSSARADFGYNWNSSISRRHRLYPFVFNLFYLGNVAEEYDDLFSTEILMRRGLFEQFIIGSEYSFTYNSQLRERSKHDWYFNFNNDVSGNTLGLLMDVFFPEKKIPDTDTYEIWGQSFAQFTKIETDLRYYFQISRGHRLASRFIAGLGLPYGNSTGLPYVKLFTVGGSNSIRAFQPRTLGPGTYSSDQSSTLDIFNAGNLKLEMNLEYRFPMSGPFHGAVFVDAGNVWHTYENPNTPGGMFKRDEFLQQVAMGTGLGFRIDFSIIILRLDIAFPLAIPYNDSEGYWEPIRMAQSQWRREKLNFNLGIGYPF